ncbi:hypothetical protein LTR70_005017 [Exophiala xenobiotica]|uniref:Uncharacterized protein n=1 Tax=Lithohypha guttulata TaxID=1690604 RepID=A0ABR0KC61_9EURO|nr:hypothetical protein LTR24_004421 [Lithohypha guttulata]KAK5319398.1 hypothetical protein LTR70_005017 [Exophiala xenobiotica]
MARTKQCKPGGRARREAKIAREALANSVSDVEHLIVKFNEGLRRWKNHKAHVKTQIDPLKEALRSAQNTDTSDTMNILELTGAVEDFEELVSNICAASDGNVAYEITTQDLQEESEVSSIKPQDGGSGQVEELEQVITRYQDKAVACIEVGLKALADSISCPGFATEFGREELVGKNERTADVGKSKQESRHHALSEFGDQIKVILERTRLLSTNLVYGSWNAACEVLETCGQHAGLKSENRPDMQLINEELQYVLDGAGDLQKLFNIDPDQLETTLREAEAYRRPPPVALVHTKSTIPIFELTVSIVEIADVQAPITWQSRSLQVVADRCKKITKANGVVNYLWEDYVRASKVAPGADYFNLFHVEVPSAANPTKRITVKGSKAWTEWFTAIVQQPHGDVIKATFWFHAVAKEETGCQDGSKKRKLDEQGTSIQVSAAMGQAKLFRAREWMMNG